MRLRIGFLIVLILILAALVSAGAAFYVVHFKSRALVIADSGSGKVYGRVVLDEPGEFSIEFVHSVNQSPVRETYRAEGKMLRAEAIRFYSFGAGMQSDLEEGQTLSRDGDAMVISGFNVLVRELNYIVGTVSDHLLIVNGEAFSLCELCGKNAHVKLFLK